MNLKIIIGSTRPNRQGLSVGNWFVRFARENSDFNVELLDLKEINLPFLDEAEHPRLGQYQHAHTLRWSRMIADGDAFVWVTPEYNYSMPASIKNALDYLHREWKEKPTGFVSYGGASGGMRAVQELKQPITTLNMMPIAQAVNIHFVQNFVNENRIFEPDEAIINAAHTLLRELYRWAKALKRMREEE